MELNKDVAKDFFASLYEETLEDGINGNFDVLASKLIAKSGETVVSGDQALQSLMLNYVLSSPENAEKGQEIAAALGHIKQRAVKEFASKFPNTNLDELIEAAKNAGYDVNILKM